MHGQNHIKFLNIIFFYIKIYESVIAIIPSLIEKLHSTGKQDTVSLVGKCIHHPL